MTTKPTIHVGLAFIACLLVGAGCSGGSQKPDTSVLKTGAFSHELHLSGNVAVLKGNGGSVLACKDCHESTEKTGFVVQRPGKLQHSPCDTCHAEAFYAKPGKVCGVCHSDVDPLKAGGSPLFEYPRRAHTAQLIGEFNHQQHLTTGKLDCNSCHKVNSAGDAYASFPTHAECVQCHAKGDAKPAMTECASCHQQQGPGRGRKFTKNDIRFTHGKHMKDAGGAIECRRCHYAVAKSTVSADINLPLMADCAVCHDDATRAPDRVRMKNCGVCHTGSIDSKNLPGNHTARLTPKPTAPTPARPMYTLEELTWDAEAVIAQTGGVVVVSKDAITPKKPENHTMLFRSRHAQAASSKNAKCGYCHSGLSGSPRNACNECHSVMRPRNHTMRWRSVQHGRVAARDAKKCGTCHEVDFCTECHAITPPSHSPVASFRYRHGRQARFNPRSCMTCHTFESTCVDCHSGGLTNPAPATSPLFFKRGGR